MRDCITRLSEVFRAVFEDEDLVITRATTAKDVEGWDSVMHVTLIVNVERAFGMKFTSAEVAGFRNVGEMADVIARRAAPD